MVVLWQSSKSASLIIYLLLANLAWSGQCDVIGDGSCKCIVTAPPAAPTDSFQWFGKTYVYKQCEDMDRWENRRPATYVDSVGMGKLNEDCCKWESAGPSCLGVYDTYDCPYGEFSVTAYYSHFRRVRTHQCLTWAESRRRLVYTGGGLGAAVTCLCLYWGYLRIMGQRTRTAGQTIDVCRGEYTPIA